MRISLLAFENKRRNGESPCSVDLGGGSKKKITCNELSTTSLDDRGIITVRISPDQYN
jgi:hypothetical protein